ncbi:MAG: hypothetical protein JGK17_00595 [Microcoleus sp. PH2017_10_PVI_O_A]|uniref:hypothetical protein n=1 Tax=unclassified Microcoleus TaxID=2642155 RepID=UPI001DDA9690|nr:MULTISPECIES: hypothetical protein [unclassified Microcoleus]TAE85890.1 MAG: hypothetical protein EAZ83_00645 [Oscillatoriales cyanobacterium]MCC3404117.1 hypothetical protein [Microcoleus sp. PH2017_10_PVI_O_A]MCC3458201.1 hypothetical protein [Microcoleus sp. PH2017_11_PCY_U_A]MCC3476623.1 hypothetical protein [Microcoleus sp. PH2017_12_PCY_D_A]MCC3527900.1 hypothetical protein [Microcoleus sp. PH2017_21_RUC_O_A]
MSKTNVKKNLSLGAKSRIAHLMGYPSKAFAIQSAIDPELLRAIALARDTTFCLLPSPATVHPSDSTFNPLPSVSLKDFTPGRSAANRAENRKWKCDSNHSHLPNKLLSIFK